MSALNLVPPDDRIRKNWGEDVLKSMIATQIRDLRETNGWTQERLAKSLKTKISAISRLESGNSFPTVSTMQKIAAVFDVALVIRFESWRGWLQWIIDYDGSRIVPFTKELSQEPKHG